ncbi:MAG: RNA methyltransferase [Desulfobacterales bacterium]|nr:RNA methyltransferase [Desulfobacterales bacterium]
MSGRDHDFFAVCPPGLRQICHSELTALPGRLEKDRITPVVPDIKALTALPGGIRFVSRLDAACLANIFLGSPTRILMRIAGFKADNFSRLEHHVKSIDWELFLPPDLENRHLNIQVTARKSRLYHSDAIAERIRPLILNHLKYVRDHLPAVSGDSGPRTQTLMIRADQDRFKLSLDMSGASLYKRGIKQKIVRAPLRETLAYAILKRLNFSSDDTLVDPMCGSGTFSLEGAMIRAAVPPGLFRRFAFEAWPGFREKGFRHARTRVQDGISPATAPSIFASDLDAAAVSNLKDSLSTHPLFGSISADTLDFFDVRPPDVPAGTGVVVLNPPYGRRLEKGMDKGKFFREIGKKLAKDFKGFRAGIIYPEKHLAKDLGLNLSPMTFFHGGLDLYAGIGRI